MKVNSLIVRMFLAVSVITIMMFGIWSYAAAHCDTLDGPVIQDAREALDAGDVAPVLKWVRQKDEKVVRASFARALNAKGKKNAEAAENQFFATLVKIHRAGEGAPFTGLKPAGQVEPSIIEADIALASGSSDALVEMVTDDVAAGIKERYEHAAATFIHKDDSVEQGREFVKAYVEFTHYVERLHLIATGKGPHNEHGEESGRPAVRHDAAKERMHGH